MNVEGKFMKRILSIFAASAALSGCLGASTPVPPDTYYRIEARPSERVAPSPVFSGVLSVESFDADGLIRERPLLFSDESPVHGIRQLNYHFWIDPPTRLLQSQLAAYVRNSGLAGTVVTPDMRVHADFELQGRVRRLERVMTEGSPSVVAEVELTLIRAEDRRLLFSDTYTAEIATKDDSVPAAVAAINEAVSEIFQSFVSEAGGALQTASE